MKKGLMISFEGPDGAGKTTVLEAVLPLLREKLSQDILTTREPGGVTISEEIRHIILDVKHTQMDKKNRAIALHGCSTPTSSGKGTPSSRRRENSPNGSFY